MRVFDIYHHPKYGLQAVRRGFSWLAFLAPSVWAVRRGLGITTLLLVVATTLMFDIAQVASNWVSHPAAQITILLALVIVVGAKPGFIGYRWHQRALEEDEFNFMCTVAAESRRKAIHAAANDEYFNGPIRVASA
jgi:hypothetical protein